MLFFASGVFCVCLCIINSIFDSAQTANMFVSKVLYSSRRNTKMIKLSVKLQFVTIKLASSLYTIFLFAPLLFYSLWTQSPYPLPCIQCFISRSFSLSPSLLSFVLLTPHSRTHTQPLCTHHNHFSPSPHSVSYPL